MIKEWLVDTRAFTIICKKAKMLFIIGNTDLRAIVAQERLEFYKNGLVQNVENGRGSGEMIQDIDMLALLY